MRGIVGMLAVVIVMVATAAQATPASAVSKVRQECEAPTISHIHWSWRDDFDGVAIEVYGALDTHEGSGTLYLNEVSTGPYGGLIEDTLDFYGPGDMDLLLSTDTQKNWPFVETVHFVITWESKCGTRTLVSFSATVGKPGSISPPAPKAPAHTTNPSKQTACPEYYVIDSRGSGESRTMLSGPGAAFVQALGKRHSVRAVTNPYKAVGIIPTLQQLKAATAISWAGVVARLRATGTGLNGLGALLRSTWIGAYQDSVNDGEVDLRRMIKQEVAACGTSGTELLLDGYSQGAEVTADVYQALKPGERRHVAGVVLFGDPRYNHLARAADTVRRDNNGILRVRNLFPEDSRGKVRSYCNGRDPICQGLGQFILHGWGAHRTYVQLQAPQVAASYFDRLA